SQIRVNGRSRAREVRVIMGSTGEQLGVMKLSDALRKAQNLGLDLVEVAPTANPPVCKIVDFGKFRYDISKQEKDKKTTGTKLKEIKFRVNIDDHDYFTKIRHGEEFLDRGNKVRVQLQFRGREMARFTIGSTARPRIESAGPHIPASHRNAVPPGKICSSAVWTWVWVPITADALPSKKRPMAIFSLVVSPCASTKITCVSWRIAATAASIAGN